jgi:hypothetical protein
MWPSEDFVFGSGGCQLMGKDVDETGQTQEVVANN